VINRAGGALSARLQGETFMSEAISIDDFIAHTQLPDGLCFKDWGTGCVVSATKDESAHYLSTCVIAVERTSDGALSQFEISHLTLSGDGTPKEMSGKLLVRKVDMENAVAKAIKELSAPCN
jgi:hypothetical protein